MSLPEQVRRYAVAFAELGPRPIFENLLYRFGLASGHYRRALQASLRANQSIATEFKPAFQPADPDRLKVLLAGTSQAEADQILTGKFQPFGGKPAVLNLQLGASPLDWTRWKPEPNQDIKDFWEPARFGWAVTLARAFRATGEDRYAECFWRNFEAFTAAHPAYTGPQWTSAQEAALRLIHFCLAGSELFAAPASSADRRQAMAAAIAEHASRIPPTMVYASAQQNNHLLSEAVGLVTAAHFLPGHPQAPHWRELGWREFERGILTQIDSDGNYGQQSTGYHRLMLTLALWMNVIRDRDFSPEVLHRLQASTAWLAELERGLDGHTPNLGSNDGSLILPLGQAGVEEYGSTVKAAMAVFNGMPVDRDDELSAWLARPAGIVQADFITSQSMQRLDGQTSVGFLRTARFFSRPAHADQLHFDLWWHGQNILRDPGTYSYNAPAPWQNSLAGTDVHNTVSVDGADQMTRLGKFLWVDRADALVSNAASRRLTARHAGYKRLGILHEREVQLQNTDDWLVIDRMLPAGGRRKPHTFRLHWLLPDALPMGDRSAEAEWRWVMEPLRFRLIGRLGEISLAFSSDPASIQPEYTLYRQGEVVYGEAPAHPTWGWESPTYGVLKPALSLAVCWTASAPLVFTTQITLLAGGK